LQCGRSSSMSSGRSKMDFRSNEAGRTASWKWRRSSVARADFLIGQIPFR
jgi:hypothetical protein